VVALGQLADLILFDVKLMDDVLHRRYTGVSNEQILANLSALDAVHRNLWLRVPLIPGITDTPANLEATAKLASSLHNVRRVTILPYHKTGVQKFRRLGMECVLESLEPPTQQQLDAAAAVFESAGLPVALGA
jgi:pyruvate formate lyase activating enzyme